MLHFFSQCRAALAEIYGSNAQFGKSLSQDFCRNSRFGKRRNTVCTRKGYAASVSQLVPATAALYFSFFKLKKWGKKTAEARRHNCAVLP